MQIPSSVGAFFGQGTDTKRRRTSKAAAAPADPSTAPSAGAQNRSGGAEMEVRQLGSAKPANVPPEPGQTVAAGVLGVMAPASCQGGNPAGAGVGGGLEGPAAKPAKKRKSRAGAKALPEAKVADASGSSQSIWQHCRSFSVKGSVHLLVIPYATLALALRT